jgi:hypothetical protein
MNTHIYSHATINDKEVIQMVARKYGLNQTNEYYRHKAKSDYQREISSIRGKDGAGIRISRAGFRLVRELD